MPISRISLVVLTSVAAALSLAAPAAAQFYQDQNLPVRGRYSFINPGQGYLGSVHAGYARMESPEYIYGQASAPTNLSATRIGGALGYTLGEWSEDYTIVMGTDFRIVGSGSYMEGSAENFSATTGGTVIFPVDGSGGGPAPINAPLFVPGTTRNAINLQQDQAEVSVMFMGDHHFENGIVITKGIGYTFMQRNQEFIFRNATVATGTENMELLQDTSTNYNTVDVLVGLRAKITPTITYFFESRLGFFRANAELNSEQQLANLLFPVGQIESTFDVQSEFGVRPYLETGLVYENAHFHIGCFGFYEHFSYAPLIRNPNNFTDPAAFLDTGAANVLGVRLVVGGRF